VRLGQLLHETQIVAWWTPDRQINPRTGTQQRVQICKGLMRFGKKHTAKARKEPVKWGIFQLDRGSISADEPNVGDSSVFGTPQRRGRQVG
jgi:hypothetical protein